MVKKSKKGKKKAKKLSPEEEKQQMFEVENFHQKDFLKTISTGSCGEDRIV